MSTDPGRHAAFAGGGRLGHGHISRVSHPPTTCDLDMTPIPTTAPSSGTDFDLDEFVDVHQGELVIKHPVTGAPTPIVIILAGPEHPARRAAAFDRARRMRAQLQKTGKIQFDDPEDDFARQTDELVTYTLGWRKLRRGGEEIAYSPAACRSLYDDAKLRWLRDQVTAALEERDRFIGSSATT